MDEEDYYDEYRDYENKDYFPNIFIEGPRATLNIVFARYVAAINGDGTVLCPRTFMRRNRLILYDANSAPGHDWNDLKPQKLEKKLLKEPVPPQKVIVYIDREQERNTSAPCRLLLALGNSLDHHAAINVVSGDILNTTLDNVLYVPAEPFYSTATITAWEKELKALTDYNSMNLLDKEMKIRLEFFKELKPDNAVYTQSVGNDVWMKPAFCELLTPKRANSPRLMITSVMRGSLLCWDKHPKDKCGLQLCHVHGGTTEGNGAAKAFEQMCLSRCTFNGKRLQEMATSGVWGPCEYGGNRDDATVPLAGTSLVVGAWSEKDTCWRLWAYVFDANDETVCVVNLRDPGWAQEDLDRDWLKTPGAFFV